MRSACGVVVGLVLALVVGTSQGQDVPRLTKERQAAVDEFIQAGVKAGAIEVPAKGPVRIDEKKLRGVVADRRDKVNIELGDALVAFWFDVEERREPIAVALLRACGQEKKDERALGFAVFLSGKMAERQPARWREAVTSYAEATKHFATAKEPAWEAASINRLALLHKTKGDFAKAEPLFRRALALREELYPKTRYPQGHPDLAGSINNLAALIQARGDYAKAEPLYRCALEMNEGLYPKAEFPQGHISIARSLANLAYLQNAQGEYANAEQNYCRALNMNELLFPKARYPQGHFDLAGNINNLGLLYYAQGEYTKAEPLFRRALEMREGLYPKTRYPDGHPELAQSINNLALIHQEQGEYTEAEVLYHRALEMHERLFPKARFPHGNPDLALSINNLALLYQRQGDFAKAEQQFHRVLEMYEGLYPNSRYPCGHPSIASSVRILAEMHVKQGDFGKAELLSLRALQMHEALYPKPRFPQGHPEIARSLHALASVHMAMGIYTKAEPLLRRALVMHEALYPKTRYPAGHTDLARSMNNLAMLYQDQGDYVKGELLYRRALKMREMLYPKARFAEGHPNLAQSFNNLASLYCAQGEFIQAEALYRQALEMCERLYPKTRYPAGHTSLALCNGNLAKIHRYLGNDAKAVSLHRRAVEMFESLYPKTRFLHGHPHLVRSMLSLAALYTAQGKYTLAEPLSTRALGMTEGLYPKERFPQGHPDLAQSINNLAMLHQAQGEYAKAVPHFRRVLDMYEGFFPKARYPQGHTDLATSINNLAALHRAQGEYAKAEPLFRRALQMREGLYPKGRFPQGHPHLARSITNLAALHKAKGEHAKAEPLYRQALEMNTASAVAIAASSTEATALNYLSSLPLSRDGYLSVTRDAHMGETYKAVWLTKAALSRVFERRHLAALATANPEARQLWDEIMALRRDRERLLLAPVEVSKTQARDKRLDEIEEEIRKKDVALLPRTPALTRSEEFAKATPDDLRKTLPKGVALVDFVRYIHTEHDPKVKGIKGAKRIPSYAAFVLTHEAVNRVELGDAKDIEDMLNLWRRAITEGSPSEPDFATKMHGLIWNPLVHHLPKACSLVYVGPDAALHGLPWAALRESKSGRLLIEDHAVAVVPHGPMLLDRLTQEKRQKQVKPTLLAMGGVEYDKAPAVGVELALRSPVGDEVIWKPLKATKAELDQIVTLARDKKVIRREEQDAGISTLLADLPKAQMAHLATHGFFADKKFRSVFQLDEKLFTSTEFASGGTAQRVGAAARSPLVLSGLVCSGANRKETPNRGILTAEAIVGLDLRKMDLAVLSACETGLGDVASGEGVFGLTRAFHIAGCRNVCASLWQVEDEATAALMVLFYRQLWGKEPVPPAEALRRAQVALYREPERIKEWSVGRGPLPRPVAAGGKTTEKTPMLKASPARTWAGFVLSGPGD